MSAGAFDILSKKDQEDILELHARHHYRNGVLHEDGSLGVIKATPKEFRDALAEAFMLGFLEGEE